jgi:signal transduction histidine kinase
VASTGTQAPPSYRTPVARGILVFRWVALSWMTFIALTGPGDFRRPWLAWGSIAAAAAWTAWLTVGGYRRHRGALLLDLALCTWLIAASALVVPEGDLVSGRQFFATGYPLSAALLWGMARGPAAGFAAGAVLSTALVVARPLNGIALAHLEAPDLLGLAGSIINYLVAGAAVGLVSRLLWRSEIAVKRATDELVSEREHSARLKEREKIARQIHDSVLQALALIHKRGRDLAAEGPVPAPEVAKLADIAGHQERDLRSLILREPEAAPRGRASLRETLEAAARATQGLEVSVSTVGPIWLAIEPAQELSAAVRQGLENVAEHARATLSSVFAEEENGWVIVTIRDDGVGFVYDEEKLRSQGKAGMLKSMKGRVEDLGGTMTVNSNPGSGTEIELRVPVPQGH